LVGTQQLSSGEQTVSFTEKEAVLLSFFSASNVVVDRVDHSDGSRTYVDEGSGFSSGAFSSEENLAVLNWPPALDLYPGPIEVTFFSEDPVELVVQRRDSLQRRLPVRWAVAPANQDFAQRAVARAERIYRKAGVFLQIKVVERVGDCAAEAQDGVINLIDADVDGFGFTPRIPNLLLAHPDACTIVNVAAHSDADRLGDTLAHEIGHHAGLFHTVEDALDDTCASASCSANLMNAEGPSGEVLPEVTPQQASVVLRYVGTR